MPSHLEGGGVCREKQYSFQSWAVTNAGNIMPCLTTLLCQSTVREPNSAFTGSFTRPLVEIIPRVPLAKKILETSQN